MRVIHLCWGTNSGLNHALQTRGFSVTQVDYVYQWRQSLCDAMVRQPAPDAIVASWPPGIGTIDLTDGAPPRHFLNPADDKNPGCLVDWLRVLPATVTMTDGRKWNAVPFVVVLARSFDQPFKDLGRDPIYLTWRDGPDARGTNEAAADLSEVISSYWRCVLAEFEEIGFLVRYESGRLVVTAAYKPPAESGQLIYHSGDFSNRNGHVLTVFHDAFDFQTDTADFEGLINDPAVSEAQIHEFFERHPHFLSEGFTSQPISHTRLVDSNGRLLIPDFVLRPVFARERDIRWKVLDLKRPQTALLVGPPNRRRLSADIHSAIRQLNDYADFFADPTNAAAVNAALGYSVRFPRLAVLVGRMPRGSDIGVLNQEQMRYPNVTLVTYDELLDERH